MSSSGSFKIITMDGGAAVGKSSTSRGLAERLDLMHVDTGAHYRTLTYALLAADADPEHPESIYDQLVALSLDTRLEGRSAKLSINGTPAFVIGDRLVPGAVDASSLQQIVNQERAGAKK